MKIESLVSRVKPQEVEISTNKVYVRKNIKEKTYTYNEEEITNYYYDEYQYTPDEYVLYTLKNPSNPEGGGGSTIDESRIIALENKDKQLSESIRTLQQSTSKISGIENKIGTAEGKITTIEGKIGTLEGSTSKIPGIEGKVNTLEGTINTHTQDITNLKAKDIELQREIDALKTPTE